MKKTLPVPRAFVAVMTLLAAAVGIPAAATAADDATTATIESLSFASGTVESGTLAAIEGSWSLPDHPATPAGFTVDLPEELHGNTDSFPLRAPDGSEMGSCTVTATQLDCVFDDAYLAARPLDLTGTFEFWVWVLTEVTEPTSVTYDIGGQVVPVTVTPPQGCTENCEFGGQGTEKYGVYLGDDDAIRWTVNIAAPVEGMEAGQTIRVEDTPTGGNHELVTVAQGQTFPRVEYTNEIGTSATGHGEPVNWQTLAESSVVVESPGTVTFTTQAGYFYRVLFATAATDAGLSGEHVYTNAAAVTIDSETSSASGSVTRQGGGGTGSGTDVGRFAITKDVVWGDVVPVAGLTYSGTYAVTTPDDRVLTGTFSVTEGDTWTSGTFPAGSTVEIAEDAPDASGAIRWTASFSADDLSIEGGRTVTTTLTNTPRLATGVFEARKLLAGDAAGQVPAETVFVVDYTYPAGPGYAAGSGSLSLTPGAGAVTSPALPAGAVVSLSERTPPTIDGVVWGAPQLTTTSLTIAEGATVSVVVTNPVTTASTPTPTPSVTPTPSATPSPSVTATPSVTPTPSATPSGTATTVPAPTPTVAGDGLAVTGGTVPGLVAIGGVAALAGGAALLVRRRQKV